MKGSQKQSSRPDGQHEGGPKAQQQARQGSQKQSRRLDRKQRQEPKAEQKARWETQKGAESRAEGQTGNTKGGRKQSRRPDRKHEGEPKAEQQISREHGGRGESSAALARAPRAGAYLRPSPPAVPGAGRTLRGRNARAPVPSGPQRERRPLAVNRRYSVW